MLKTTYTKGNKTFFDIKVNLDNGKILHKFGWYFTDCEYAGGESTEEII